MTRITALIDHTRSDHPWVTSEASGLLGRTPNPELSAIIESECGASIFVTEQEQTKKADGGVAVLGGGSNNPQKDQITASTQMILRRSYVDCNQKTVKKRAYDGWLQARATFGTLDQHKLKQRMGRGSFVSTWSSNGKPASATLPTLVGIS